MPTRRQFLISGSIVLQAGIIPQSRAFAQVQSRFAVILLTGISSRTPDGLLTRISSVFLDRGTPICCSYDTKSSSGDAEGFDSPAGREILALAADNPGLFEIVAQLPRRDSEQRYFQMRISANLRASLTPHATNENNLFPEATITSAFDPWVGDSLDHAAFRGAGFRVFLRPSEISGPTNVRFPGREQMELSGGEVLDLASDDSSQTKSVLRRRDIGENLLLTIPVEGLEDVPENIIAQRAAELADLLQEAAASGELFTTRANDLLFQTGPEPASSMSIVLAGNKGASGDQGLDAFASELTTAQLPFSWISDNGTAICDPADPSGEAPGCVLVGVPSENGTVLTAETMLMPPGTPGAYFGLRDDGVVQLASHGGAGLSARELIPHNPGSDLVVLITAEDVATYVKSAFLIQRLTSMRQEARVKLHTVSGLADYLFAQDPVMERFQSTRRRNAALSEEASEPVLPNPGELLDDARLAWKYIERFTHPRTGLCAGTARIGAGERINQQATLWDVASQLRGIIAAQELDIIPEDEARSRIALTLEHLPTVTLGGARLPPATLSAISGRAQTLEFDSCDTGRFLVAADATLKSGLADQDSLDALFDGWDLDQAVRENHPYDFVKGRWVDKFLSHCTPYSRAGFASRGISMDTPFLDTVGGTETDKRMRLLYRAAFIGHFGTEPALLQAIELGATPAMSYLAQVLFDAQISWFEKTGELKCASETLLDFAPWFSYQGIRFDRVLEEGWVVSFTTSNARYQTKEFQKKAEVISSKSAFLWSAAQPHPYSGRLLRFIREKARVEDLGFSAGIYADTQLPMERYSDVNTNGIILTAIAHMLRPS